MNCSQPSTSLFIHLGRQWSSGFVLPSPPPPPPPCHSPPFKIISASFSVSSLPPSIPTAFALSPPNHYLLVSCPLLPHLLPPPQPLSFFLLSFALHSFVASPHFERNRFSITCWVPGSFYISQPDPNTAEVTPHAPETHTHTLTCVNRHNTRASDTHFRLHLQTNGVKERLENVFSVLDKPGKLPDTHQLSMRQKERKSKNK